MKSRGVGGLGTPDDYAIAALNGPAWFHIQVAQLLYSGLSSRSFHWSIGSKCPLAIGVWFQKFWKYYFDLWTRSNEKWVCPVRAFSQLLQFQFSVGPDSTAIFGHKVTRNLSKLKKAENVQSVSNQTCAVFNSFFKTLHFWFIYIFDFRAKDPSNQDGKRSSNLS